MKLKSILLAGAMALAIAAGPAGAQQVPELNAALSPVAGSPMVDNAASTKDKFVLGFSNISVVNTWRVQMVEELKYEASLHPEISEMLVSDAGGDVNRQVADIESFIARGVDALLVAPGSEVALNGALDKAYDAGIPVIIFSSNATPENYTVKLLADDAQFGRDGANRACQPEFAPVDQVTVSWQSRSCSSWQNPWLIPRSGPAPWQSP